MCHLYRGYSEESFKSIADALTPKAIESFTYQFKYDGSIAHDGSGTYGESSQNAVLRHQLNQAGLPTSGVSTSPHRERALMYALSGGKSRKGFIITIDGEKLLQYGIIQHVVASTVSNPCVPEDDEVILVAPDGGPIPTGVVISHETVP